MKTLAFARSLLRRNGLAATNGPTVPSGKEGICDSWRRLVLFWARAIGLTATRATALTCRRLFSGPNMSHYTTRVNVTCWELRYGRALWTCCNVNCSTDCVRSRRRKRTAKSACPTVRPQLGAWPFPETFDRAFWMRSSSGSISLRRSMSSWRRSASARTSRTACLTSRSSGRSAAT